MVSSIKPKLDDHLFVGLGVFKVHIFWEGHKILRNLHLSFVLCSASQRWGEDFAKFSGLLRIYELYKNRIEKYYTFGNWMARMKLFKIQIFAFLILTWIMVDLKGCIELSVFNILFFIHMTNERSFRTRVSKNIQTWFIGLSVFNI